MSLPQILPQTLPPTLAQTPPPTLARRTAMLMLLSAAACGRMTEDRPRGDVPQLYPNETPELRALINASADQNGVPRSLVHKVVQRESRYQPTARNGPYWGLMQILPQTAQTMGFRGEPAELLDPAVNLRWAVRYLRGAWIVADGDEEEAIGWYARGYYYEARDRGLLEETGLRSR